MRLTDDIRQRFAFTRDLDRRAKALAEERKISIVEAYRFVLDGEDAEQGSLVELRDGKVRV